jgi:hypothetical protein
MIVVPAAIPVTTPDAEIEAVAALLLVHVPPPGVLPRLVVYPTHTLAAPTIAVGLWLTVIVLLTAHPSPTV